MTNRTQIPFDLQVKVFYRDNWLCHVCGRPTFFYPAIKYLELFVKAQEYPAPVCFFHGRYRSDVAPLLDFLAATIDHTVPFSKGGLHDADNFRTACNKCNMIKNDVALDVHYTKHPKRRIRRSHDEKCLWDGFASLFYILTEGRELKGAEAKWRQAIDRHIKGKT